jgi:predicted ATP-dependent protease
VDQHGNVQPIGGVNEKIEGFFKYCKVNGLTGEQGVIIPEQNVKHLMLDHEVLDAVASGKFHIWAVKNVDEGIELLTGIEAGVPDDKGCFPPDSIHGRVMAKLRGWMEKAARLKKDLDKADRCAREKQEKETDEDKDKSNS